MLKLFLIGVLFFSSTAFAENIELFADDGLEWNQKEQKIT